MNPPPPMPTPTPTPTPTKPHDPFSVLPESLLGKRLKAASRKSIPGFKEPQKKVLGFRGLVWNVGQFEGFPESPIPLNQGI